MPQLSARLADALNEQINSEIYSGYAYLSMSTHCASQNFQGAAQWLRLQWQEELYHATRLMDYVVDRGGTVTLKAINQPSVESTSLLSIFEQALAHETQVTVSIYSLCELAAAEKDYASQTMLQWYVNEQVEEEKSTLDIVSLLRLAGDSPPAILMIDRQLAQRQTVAGAQ